MKKVPNLRFKEFSGEWESKKIGSICEIIMGQSPSSACYNEDKIGLPLIQGNADVKNRKTFPRVYTSDITKTCDVGDIIMSVRAPVGAISKSLHHACIGRGVCSIKPKQNSEFIYQFLLNYENKWSRISQGSTFESINSSDITSTNVVLPLREEQEKIAAFFSLIDKKIELQTEKVEELKNYKKGLMQKMFPRNGETVPKLRFAGFTNDWEKRKLEDEFYKVNERNDGSFGKEHWISVAKMYFQDPEKVQSNNIDTRTYVMRYGDIAFEGNKSKSFKYGRFVVNDIGDGVVSELFPIYRHKKSYSNDFWKRAIQIDSIMAPIFSKCITSSGVSSNKLDDKHFLRQSIFVPDIEEQHKIGDYFKTLDKLITLQQRKLDALNEYKKGLLQQMFI